MANGRIKVSVTMTCKLWLDKERQGGHLLPSRCGEASVRQSGHPTNFPKSLINFIASTAYVINNAQLL